ncbi:hypothetical protein D9Q98_008033 [Chlorella vulgaris]|uniref:Uncharacterized protein n=1 Tax=Chlorella vulgaris TaxID=3077 RepID=A0A9D4TI37_CHLVU|nr:hypothetical protein D9Q98_008033 [Chlorella vulgaris]
MAASAVPQPERRVVKGIVFDMDGTLTKAVIDFAEMRRSVAAVGGLDSLSGDILDIIASWPAEQQQAAHAAIAVVEAKALRDMQLMPGVLELSSFLDERQVPRALVTRNVNSSIEFFHRHHFTLPPFTPALSREFAPYKPDPASLLHIAQRWSVQPGELVMIGDSAKDDIVCGNRAGALTILLDEERRWDSAEQLQGEERPHFIARTLQDVQQLLEQQVELVPPAAEPQPLT